MPDTKQTKIDHIREQAHDLAATFRGVAAAVGVPAGIARDEREEREFIDPEDIRDSIIGWVVTESEDDSEGAVP